MDCLLLEVQRAAPCSSQNSLLSVRYSGSLAAWQGVDAKKNRIFGKGLGAGGARKSRRITGLSQEIWAPGPGSAAV